MLALRHGDLAHPDGEALERVLLDAGLVVVDPDAGGDVHGRDECHPLRDARVVDRRLDVFGDPDELAPAFRVERAVHGVRSHSRLLCLGRTGIMTPWTSG